MKTLCYRSILRAINNTCFAFLSVRSLLNFTSDKGSRTEENLP